MKITETKNNRKEESNSTIKKYSDKNFRDKYPGYFSIIFTSKRSVKAGDLSGVSGKLSEAQKGSEGHPVRAFSSRATSSSGLPACSPRNSSPAGLNQILQCPCPSPSFLALSV